MPSAEEPGYQPQPLLRSQTGRPHPVGVAARPTTANPPSNPAAGSALAAARCSSSGLNAAWEIAAGGRDRSCLSG